MLICFVFLPLNDEQDDAISRRTSIEWCDSKGSDWHDSIQEARLSDVGFQEVILRWCQVIKCQQQATISTIPWWKTWHENLSEFNTTSACEEEEQATRRSSTASRFSDRQDSKKSLREEHCSKLVIPFKNSLALRYWELEVWHKGLQYTGNLMQFCLLWLSQISRNPTWSNKAIFLSFEAYREACWGANVTAYCMFVKQLKH